eukprot:6610749-Prymnesium_polylepis.2
MSMFLHDELLDRVIHAQGDDAHRVRLPRAVDALGNLLMLCEVELRLEDEARVGAGQREPRRKRARFEKQRKRPSLGRVERVEARLATLLGVAEAAATVILLEQSRCQLEELAR